MTPWRVVVIGSVGSTARTLDGLVRLGVPVVGVLGLAQSRAHTVSGWRDIEAQARALGLPARTFAKVGEPEVLAQLRTWAPDVLMVVGLSQLVGEELLATARHAALGFHPTRLPLGRGRAPLAWLALGAAPGAATFFHMTAGADEGPIAAQAPFEVPAGVDAAEVESRMLAAIDEALTILAPGLVAGALAKVPQDDAIATWLGRRADEDGVIDWEAPAAGVIRLVRASAPPNPGALTYWQDAEVRVLAAEHADGTEARWHGVAGRVLAVGADGALLVQCGDAPVRLTRVAVEGRTAPLPVGTRLGYVTDAELASLRRRVRKLESALERAGGQPS